MSSTRAGRHARHHKPVRPRRRPLVAIITPASAEANTGNWHTAARWARFLRSACRVRVATTWSASAAQAAPDLMIALHARRSAPAIAAFATAYPDRPLIVVLTGTDLYRDIASDAAAQRSLALASRLVVLNELGARALPRRWRSKVEVILQSASRLAPATRSARHFLVAAVGHLRAEKDAALVMAAARQFNDGKVRFVHVGGALDADLGSAARATAATCPHYRWLGPQSRGAARQQMRRAHVLLHPSRMEGGAQAVIEAVTAGTPVIASAIDGNRGLLGLRYPGLFPVGNVAACVRLIKRAADDPAFLRQLARACQKRAALFDPRRESAAVRRLVRAALDAAARR